jgi:hypothetical protein
MGQIKFIGSIMMVMLFTIAIIGYATNFGIDNNSGTRIDDLDDDFTQLQTNITAEVQGNRLEVTNSSEGFFESSFHQSSDSVDTTTVTGGQFKTIVKAPVSAIKTIFGSINKNIFGKSKEFGIFLTGLISLIVIAGMLYIWKTWKGGNPN